MEFAKRELFGGAILCELPKTWVDASLGRPIPDNQEIYLHPTNQLKHFVVDILEAVPIADKDAISFHYKDLSDANQAENIVIHYNAELDHSYCPRLDTDTYTSLLIANATMGRHKDRDVINCHILIRLPKVATDILISLNNTLPTPAPPVPPKASESDLKKEGCEQKSAQMHPGHMIGGKSITENKSYFGVFEESRTTNIPKFLNPTASESKEKQSDKASSSSTASSTSPVQEQQQSSSEKKKEEEKTQPEEEKKSESKETDECASEDPSKQHYQTVEDEIFNEEYSSIIRHILSSFQIVDMSLFQPDS
ncbi:putative Ran-interacting Mog1 protein [Monocercomonoides exilis]|uniref:putative Ran-interacting Mog1 protein n=1 Tax=Monocercomonoides exilis TaxID=2049356 RepID=UPI00355A648A|nr:putative Ran-interacting Mog1 protein [Monocercomonoides exilis]|eukprot:MONOS_9638.1-p1 / transcript=MONOS_9638.1 / gene=MONOS_9638 / organism=Monocercomonoides_exilis_PA203 / gene_product=Ran-interacting Mog1 protein / transcript_product=Ran-interacting Mog1 protein / location=Mono_scaffold00404:49211-50328(-) / protein_length=309 / sequence_SO=supercontig / SO=protein_coding / is_pseudo=false